MSHILSRTGFLAPWKPCIVPVRTRRVNIQKPRPPFYTRALFEAIAKPYFKPKDIVKLPPSMTCLRKKELEEDSYRPDNPYENLVAKEAMAWFQKSKLICLLHTNPIPIEEKFEADLKFKREKMTFKVYSHHTLRIGLKDSIFEPALILFKSHTGIVFSQDILNAAKLIKIIKKIPQYIILAAIVEGRLLSYSQPVEFSQLKDIDQARSALVATLDSARGGPSSLLNRHQMNLVATLQQHADLNLKT